jgi:hypothetical protein
LKPTGTFLLKRDEIGIGIVLGLIAPMIVLLIIYAIQFRGYAFMEFIRMFTTQRSLITFFGAWCLVGNVALFTFYINTNRDRTARGIFAVTLIYGIGVLLAKAII